MPACQVHSKADGRRADGQDVASKTLRIQLMGPEDPSVDEDDSAVGRWRAYVASYVLVHPTEWVPAGSSYGPVYLKRYAESQI